MNKYATLCLLLVLTVISAHAQDGDFPGDDATYAELEMPSYKKDTTANAVVLNEFGRTHIVNDQDNGLIHEYHVRIKIFNEKGVDAATFVIPIRKSEKNGDQEEVHGIYGTTFNLVGGQRKATMLSQKRVYTENKNRYYDQVKFTMPDVHPGSVIDVSYIFTSPYVYNYKPWEFQSDIPKIRSEYWAQIPANFVYNITLQGFYKLTRNESSRVSDCLISYGGGKADCSLLKLGMDSVPAFVEEDYMTARSNFLSAVHFELSEVHSFNGHVDKITKKWSDVDDELKNEDDFGKQLKRSGGLFEGWLDSIKNAKTEDVAKARWIYDFIKHWYKWDGYTGMFTENGLKKAFERHGGDVADINLSLVAALRYAGLQADPVTLSTRENGLPSILFPVITDFNWVVVRLKTGEDTYLLDASDPYLPFGMIPLRCLNDKGRCFPQDGPSEWIDLKPATGFRQMTYVNLEMSPDTGKISGTITLQYDGYKAVDKRRTLASFSSQDEYLEKVSGKLPGFRITGYHAENLKDLHKPLTETFSVEMDSAVSMEGDRLVLHPFVMPEFRQNPFKSPERKYPVDFGATEDIRTFFTFKFPAGYRIVSLPEKTSLMLAGNGASYQLESDGLSNQAIVRSILMQHKPLYSSDEYFSLKELYNRILQAEGSDVILAKNQK
ncbi:hypothetical protein [Compostibacter hankyongensis]|uniref:DUF3857 domain-containing protein n=1 Tax=Compostibacter hankyongensis TaxID=1007089 RepID=A0ABP8G8B2_9BACT